MLPSPPQGSRHSHSHNEQVRATLHGSFEQPGLAVAWKGTSGIYWTRMGYIRTVLQFAGFAKFWGPFWKVPRVRTDYCILWVHVGPLSRETHSTPEAFAA